MTPPTEKVIIFLVHKTWFPKSDRKTAKDARKLKKTLQRKRIADQKSRYP